MVIWNPKQHRDPPDALDNAPCSQLIGTCLPAPIDLAHDLDRVDRAPSSNPNSIENQPPINLTDYNAGDNIFLGFSSPSFSNNPLIGWVSQRPHHWS